MKPDMSMEQFGDLAAAYGADFEQWPMEHQEPAIALVAMRPSETTELLKQEVGLDNNLAALPRQRPGVDLRNKILRSFVPSIATDTFSIAGLFEIIFGRGKHARGFAFVSVLLLVASGAVGGYLGGDLLINTQDTAVWDVQVFYDHSFVLEPGAGT